MNEYWFNLLLDFAGCRHRSSLIGANGSVVEAAGELKPTASSHAKNYSKLLKSFISASSAPVG